MEIRKILGREFPNVTVYDEEIKQGFKKPYFFVKILTSNQIKELNRRYKRNVYFDISYFSDKESINLDYFNMADSLYKTLEYVEVDSKKYRTLNMKHEIVDEVLHFMFQLKFNLLKKIEQTDMEKLEVDISGK
ncbi:phage tail terminator family protein [Clostridium uliginosum]